jgi:hypothetical protein
MEHSGSPRDVAVLGSRLKSTAGQVGGRNWRASHQDLALRVVDQESTTDQKRSTDRKTTAVAGGRLREILKVIH